MHKVIAVLMLLLCVALPVFAQQHISVFDIDVSRSMLNNGKIEAAKGAIISEVPHIANGTHVILIAFGTTADEVFNSRIDDEAGRQKLIEDVSSLRATHKNTHFDEMIKQTKLSCYETRARYGNTSISVKVLSDGVSSPDETTGKRFFNLANVVSESMPRSAGFRIYILSLEDILTEPVLNVAEVEKSGVTTVPVSPKNLQTVMPQIRNHEYKSHTAANVKQPEKLEKTTFDWTLAYYGIAAVVITLALLFAFRQYKSFSQEQRRFKERINKLSNPQRSNSPLFQERLRFQEIVLGSDGKENKVEQEQFYKMIKGSRILVGRDPLKCAFVLRYPQSPEVLFSVTVRDHTLSLSNESKEPTVVNRKQLKPSQAIEQPIEEEISVIFRNKVRIAVLKERIPLQKRRETEQIKKLAEKVFVNNKSQTAQVPNTA